VDEVLREHGQAWANAFVEPQRRSLDIGGAHRHRRSWLRPAGAAAAVLGVAAATVVVVVVVGQSPAPSPAAPAPVINSRVGTTVSDSPDVARSSSPARSARPPTVVRTAVVPTTIERGAATLSLIQTTPLLEVIRDTSDPTRLWVTPNTFGPTGGGTQCSPLMQFTVTVQDAERVEIVAAAYAMDAGAAVTCTDIGQSPVQVAIPLAAPLGDRRVVDGSNAQVMTVLDPDQFPEPAYLPNGFESRGSAGIETDHGRIARTYWKGEERLEIAWSEGTFELSDVSEAISHPDVHGVTATVWKDKGFDDARLISWGAAPGWYVTIQSNAAEHQTLSAAELLKVARSMPIPDPPSPAAGDTSTSSTG
jgi:hypothetical protein